MQSNEEILWVKNVQNENEILQLKTLSNEKAQMLKDLESKYQKLLWTNEEISNWHLDTVINDLRRENDLKQHQINSFTKTIHELQTLNQE